MQKCIIFWGCAPDSPGGLTAPPEPPAVLLAPMARELTPSAWDCAYGASLTRFARFQTQGEGKGIWNVRYREEKYILQPCTYCYQVVKSILATWWNKVLKLTCWIGPRTNTGPLKRAQKVLTKSSYFSTGFCVVQNVFITSPLLNHGQFVVCLR